MGPKGAGQPFWERAYTRRTVLKGGLLGGATLVAGSWILTGCGGSGGTTTTSPSAASRGGTLRMGRPLMTSPKGESLDPASPFNCYPYLGVLYNLLARQAQDGTIMPDLATAWEASADMKTWTFTMRDGVTWHDGKPFTSKDAAYTLKHILDPETASPQAGTLSTFMKASGISTPDDKTLVVKLESPNAEFVSLLINYNCYVIPDGSAKTIGKTGIGTGPFKLVSFVPGGFGAVEVNKDYWEGLPRLDKIEYSAIGEQQARVNALLAGQVDLLIMTNLDYATTQTVNADPNLTTYAVKNDVMYVMPMLCDKSPFTDVRVRQAFKMAYQPTDLLNLAIHGQGTVANNNPVLPTDPYWLDYAVTPDPEKTKALLAEAGFSGPQDLYTSATDPVLTPLALAYQESVKAAGIAINVKNASADSYYSEIWMKKPFITSWWSTSRPIDQLLNQVYRWPSGWNESHWDNADFAGLLDSARKEADAAKRKQYYQDAQKLLIEDSGTIVPFFADRITGLSKKVVDFQAWGTEVDYMKLGIEA
jgi:peptide/nickel transport system substrate-binding protein